MEDPNKILTKIVEESAMWTHWKIGEGNIQRIEMEKQHIIEQCKQYGLKPQVYTNMYLEKIEELCKE